MAKLKKNWTTAVCIAGGPSLTQDQVDQIRRWKEQDPRHGVIAVNASFLVAPWADIIYGLDPKFWMEYRSQIPKGPRLCSHVRNSQVDVVKTYKVGNSGANAIPLAIAYGADRILLVGYDSKLGPNGETHHHGDHPSPLMNCTRIESWPERFGQIRRKFGNKEIINCSIETALKCFPRGTLERELSQRP